MRKTGSSKCIICFCKNSFFVSNISLDLQNRYKHVRVLHFQWLIDSFRLRFRHFRSYQTPNLKKNFKNSKILQNTVSQFCYENSVYIYGFQPKKTICTKPNPFPPVLDAQGSADHGSFHRYTVPLSFLSKISIFCHLWR